MQATPGQQKGTTMTSTKTTIKGHGFTVGDLVNFYGMGSDDAAQSPTRCTLSKADNGWYVLTAVDSEDGVIASWIVKPQQHIHAAPVDLVADAQNAWEHYVTVATSDPYVHVDTVGMAYAKVLDAFAIAYPTLRPTELADAARDFDVVYWAAEALTADIAHEARITSGRDAFNATYQTMRDAGYTDRQAEYVAELAEALIIDPSQLPSAARFGLSGDREVLHIENFMLDGHSVSDAITSVRADRAEVESVAAIEYVVNDALMARIQGLATLDRVNRPIPRREVAPDVTDVALPFRTHGKVKNTRKARRFRKGA